MGLVSKQCVDFVKKFEGFYSRPYKDIVGVKTLGYGMTGKEIEGLSYVSEKEASKMLEELLNKRYAAPLKLDLDHKKVKLNQNEFDALVSMAYNVGVTGVLNSTLYKNICRGIRDRKIITSNFQMWCKAGGKKINGLYRRRTEEAEMFFKKTNSIDKKYNRRYVLSFQKFYNKVTETALPLAEDGIMGFKTREAFKNLVSYIGLGSKYRYCIEFQKWFNKITQTGMPISEDGIYGLQTKEAIKTIEKLIEGEY